MKTSKLIEERKSHVDAIDNESFSYFSYSGPYKREVKIAEYYGFNLIQPPTINRETTSFVRSIIGKDERIKKSNGPLPEICLPEKIALMREYIEKEMRSWPQPVMFAYISRKNGKTGNNFFKLELIGSSKSICEALLMHISVIMLKDAGHKNLCININSVGDKESLSAFYNELTSYYRKNINLMNTFSREMFKKHPFKLLTSSDPRCKAINDGAPQSVNFLSEKSRRHFKETIEYLDMTNTPYRINPKLVADKSCCSETIFEINEYIKEPFEENTSETNSVLAQGTRSNFLGKKLGYKKDLPSISASILLSDSEMPDNFRALKNSNRSPKIYFIQLGPEAKLKSLEIIEKLRQANIPVHQSLNKDKMTMQIAVAEKLKTPFTIIMGQKEVIDGTVIVREKETRFQETVPIKNLTNYLKANIK